MAVEPCLLCGQIPSVSDLKKRFGLELEDKYLYGICDFIPYWSWGWEVYLQIEVKGEVFYILRRPILEWAVFVQVYGAWELSTLHEDYEEAKSWARNALINWKIVPGKEIHSTIGSEAP